MSFQKIEMGSNSFFERAPIEISLIFENDLVDGNLVERFIRLEGDNCIAFILYRDWNSFNQKIKEGKIFDEDGKPFTDETVQLYLKSYSEGFTIGCNSFEENLESGRSIFKFDNEESAKRVFSFIHESFYPFSENLKDWYSRDGSEKKQTLTHISLVKWGEKLGEIYKAWYIIINNSELFLPLFKSKYINIYRLIDQEFKKLNGNNAEYKSPLQTTIDEYDKISLDKTITARKKPALIAIENLKEVVKNDEAESRIYKILIDAKLIDPDTKIFIDKMGVGKGYFYSTIEVFYEKDYFTRRPKKAEYLNICNNTFKAGVSEGTAKNNKSRAGGLKNIPPFS